KNYTLTNMILEGMLTAKERFPSELAEFDVDMRGFVRATSAELERRRAQGVDVSAELRELDAYIATDASLSEPDQGRGERNLSTLARDARERARRLQSRVLGRRNESYPAAVVRGDQAGFVDALSAAEMLSARIEQLVGEPDRPAKRLAS